MAPSRAQLALRVFLASVWLAIVSGAVYMAVTQRYTYGYVSFLAPVIALFMLVIFALAYLPRSVRDRPLGKRLGHLATGALVLLVLIVLGVETMRWWRKPFNAIALGFFFVIFLGIFRDWLRSYLHPEQTRKRRRKSRKTKETPETTEQSEAEPR